MRRLPVALTIVVAVLVVVAASVSLLLEGSPSRDNDELAYGLLDEPEATLLSDGLPLALVRLPAPQVVFGATLDIAGAASAREYGAARAAFDAADYETAARIFEEVVAADGLLAPMAGLRLAQSLVAADRRDEAAGVFAAVIDGGRLPPSIHLVALTEAASNLERLDQPKAALAVLQRVGSVPGLSATQRAEAFWRSANMRRDMGDPDWGDDAVAVLTAAPASLVARDALDAVEEAGLDVPPMTLALATYRARRNDTARDLYREIARDGSFSTANRATAWFYLGALEERRDEPEAALEAYARSLELAPNGSLAADAVYWRGRVLEEMDRPLAAAREYDRLLDRYPGSRFAPDARLRAAVGVGLAGEHADALGRLEAIANATSGGSAAAAARWHTVFRESFGASSDSPLDPAAFHPASLWSLLDASTQHPLPATGDVEAFRGATGPTPQEIADVRAWLTERYGAPARTISYASASNAAELGFALTSVGEPAVGRALLQDEVWDAARTPHELLDLSVAAHQAGLHDISLRAAMRIVSPLSAWERMDAPRALLQLAYPIPYQHELAAAIGHSPVSPLLLLALVRQESAFNPDAVSHANAIGLAQVIPSTGADIARALDEPWDPARLRDPAVSLRFGAYYLRAQLRNFDGDVLAALGAYNAGGGSVQRWRRDQRFDGPDGFIHTVDFAETRLYFEHVLENYAWYRYIYGASEAPSLR